MFVAATNLCVILVLFAVSGSKGGAFESEGELVDKEGTATIGLAGLCSAPLKAGLCTAVVAGLRSALSHSRLSLVTIATLMHHDSISTACLWHLYCIYTACL